MIKDKYKWIDETLEDVIEKIVNEQTIQFQYKGKDYKIEARVREVVEGLLQPLDPDDIRVEYHIVDPCIKEDGTVGPEEIPYEINNIRYVASQMLATKFLDGKTIIEKFDELKFFAN